MNLRETMLGLAENRGTPGYVPAAFFLHFDPAFHRGQAAVDRHLEYFHATGMDFVKVQYEHPFPRMPQITRPEDWEKTPRFDQHYFAEPLEVISGIVKAVKKEALVVVTLYSAVMHAAHATSRDLLTEHLQQDPERTTRGLKIIDESILVFVRECVKRGVDGFYASTQGGEADRFRDPSLFTRYLKPIDLLVMNEINRLCPFNILHVCDYHGVYADLAPYLDYPGQIVNCGTRLRSGERTPGELSRMFARPFLGGMDRHGVLVTGTREQIQRQVQQVLHHAPPAFALGADCTVPSDISVENLKTAIETAHFSAGRP
jgi:uroporphyrinogen decarboxylase